MTFIEFFGLLIGVGVSSSQSLRLEQFAVSQAEQETLRAGTSLNDAIGMDVCIEQSRKKIWQSIETELKRGETVENVLALLL